VPWQSQPLYGQSVISRSGGGTTLQLSVPLPAAPDGTASHC